MNRLRRLAFAVSMRAALVAGLASAIGAGPATAAPVAVAGYSHVSVDISALEARGLGVTARFLGAAVSRQMQQQFAGLLGARGGPAIVVRLTGLSLPAYVGSDSMSLGGRWGGGSVNDYLEGETLVVGRNGAVLARYPILTNLPSSSGGAWYDPDIDRKRLIAIAGAYAGWSRRYVTSR